MKVQWVSKAVGPVIQAMTRGLLTSPEQPELLRMLCCVILPFLPDYVVSSMILELLGSEAGGNWEAAMAGLLGLLSLLAEAPAYAEGR